MTEVISECTFSDSFDSDCYFITSVSVSWVWEDCGIGSYEFWGTVSNDVNMQLELDSYFVEMIDVYDSDDMLVHSIENTEANRSTFKDIFDFVIAYVDNEVDGVEPPDDCYGDYYE